MRPKREPELSVGNGAAHPQVNQFRFQIPEIGVKTLPSGFKAYPKKTREVVTYKPYSLGEISFINESKNLPKVEEYKIYLESIEASFGKENLTLSDFFFISILRKLSSPLSSIVNIKAWCEGIVDDPADTPEESDTPRERKKKLCDKELLEQRNLQEIGFFPDMKAPELPIPLEIEPGLVLEFAPITVKDFFFLERLPQGEPIGGLRYSATVVNLALQCKNLPFEEAYRAVYHLHPLNDADDIAKIRDYLSHEISPTTLTCPDCGYQNSIELVGREDVLVYPFRGPENPSRIRLRSGV